MSDEALTEKITHNFILINYHTKIRMKVALILIILNHSTKLAFGLQGRP